MFDPDAILDSVVGQLAWHAQRLHTELFFTSEPAGCEPPYAIQIHLARTSSPLAEEIRLLCRVANGEVARVSADEMAVGEIAETVQGIVEALCVPPFGPSAYTVPDVFWQTPVGEVVASVQLWLRGDDLISFAEAARLLWPDEARDDARINARVRRLAERGEVRRYRNPAPDGSARGPWLVSRHEIERMAAGTGND